MSRVDVVILGAVIVVMGCATTPKEEAQPASRLSRPERPIVQPRVHVLTLDARTPARALGSELAARATELGVAGPTAFVWGDVSPAPSGARRIEIRAGNTSVQGFLIPSAHEVDMGQLAPGIHNVVMVGCDDRGLYGSHPSGPGRHRIEFGAADGELERESREIFGFVSLMPGDVSEGVTSGQVLSLLKELPSRVRYAVMALPS